MTSPALLVLVLAHAYSCSSIETQADHGTPSLTTIALRNPNIIAMETLRTNLATNLDLAFKDTISDDIKATDVIKYRHFDTQKYNKDKVRRVKREDDQETKCEAFEFNDKEMKLTHPHDRSSKDKNYYNNTECVTVIEAKPGQVIKVTFVDIFHIENHPKCSYDFLEIRDGKFGYARSLGKLCGEAFPGQITTSGPYMWLKFRSDETIEYEGFHISVAFEDSSTSRSIPDSCYVTLGGIDGDVDPKGIDDDCKTRSAGNAMEVVWTIQTPENTGIYLNFVEFNLAKPNECEENIVQVFGNKLEEETALAHYCGSIANAVLTKASDSKLGTSQTNIMHIRMFHSVSTTIPEFLAKYTAFRTLNVSKNEECLPDTEFSCGDNTCIDSGLWCNGYPNCRLKTDEEPGCDAVTSSILLKKEVLVILVIFSLILSGMCFVFLFKCIRKLYQDHEIIKEHIRQSCEDRLDTIIGDNLFPLDPKQLQRDSVPHASLERDNRANELFKQQRKLSGQTKPSSIDSDFVHETHLDLHDDPWRRDVESIPIAAQDIKIERNGRTRRSTTNKDSFRSRKEKEKKEIRDASVGAPDTKESGCQTRESLFETGQPPSSEGSGSNNSRGFSTFGYSGATIARPSPPGPNASQITIELMKHSPPQDLKTQKKLSERRPMSTETTRSAPDVIIVSKPLR